MKSHFLLLDWDCPKLILSVSGNQIRKKYQNTSYIADILSLQDPVSVTVAG